MSEEAKIRVKSSTGDLVEEILEKNRKRRKKHKLPKPESGGKPKRITTKSKPGGPHTPGAKQEPFLPVD